MSPAASPSTVLIAGCGYVGSALAARLVSAGHTVHGLRRNPSGLPAGVIPLAADLLDPDLADALPDGIDRVAYTTGASGFTEAAYEAAYVTGLRNLIAALEARKAPIQRIVFTSSTGVYGQSDGEWVDEDRPATATGFSGRYIREGEKLLETMPFETVSVRLGGIYGPGRTRLIETVRDGSAVITDGPPRYLNLNHRDDCASALEHLLFLDKPAPVYLATDGHPEDRAVILRWIAEQLNIPEPPTVPESEAPRLRTGNKRCRNERLLATGFRFAYPDYRDGYGPLIAEMTRG